MSKEDHKREMADLAELVGSSGWARFTKEAQERREGILERLLALKPVEANVRHLIARSAAHKENEELVSWPETRLRSLQAAEARQ